MNIDTLQHTIVDGLEDVKAHDIEIFNTTHLSRLFDRVIIASGTSNQHTRALAMRVRKKVKAAGFEVRGMEGMDAGEWVLVDCLDAVVHLFLPALRQYYRLEEIWGEGLLQAPAPSPNLFLKPAHFGQDETESDATAHSGHF